MKKGFLIVLLTILLSSCINLNVEQKIEKSWYSKIEVLFDLTILNKMNEELENFWNQANKNVKNTSDKSFCDEINVKDNLNDYECKILDKNNVKISFNYKISNKYLYKYNNDTHIFDILEFDNSMNDTGWSDIWFKQAKELWAKYEYNIEFPTNIIHNDIWEKNWNKIKINYLDIVDNKKTLIFFSDKQQKIEKKLLDNIYKLEDSKYYLKELIISNSWISSKNEKYKKLIKNIKYKNLNQYELYNLKYRLGLLKSKIKNKSDSYHIINMLESKVSMEIIKKESGVKNTSWALNFNNLELKENENDIKSKNENEIKENIWWGYVIKWNNIYYDKFNRMELVEDVDINTYWVNNNWVLYDKDYFYYNGKKYETDLFDYKYIDIKWHSFSYWDWYVWLEVKWKKYIILVEEWEYKIKDVLKTEKIDELNNFRSLWNNIYYENNTWYQVKLEWISLDNYKIIKDKNNELLVNNKYIFLADKRFTHSFDLDNMKQFNWKYLATVKWLYYIDNSRDSDIKKISDEIDYKSLESLWKISFDYYLKDNKWIYKIKRDDFQKIINIEEENNKININKNWVLNDWWKIFFQWKKIDYNFDINSIDKESHSLFNWKWTIYYKDKDWEYQVEVIDLEKWEFEVKTTN